MSAFWSTVACLCLLAPSSQAVAQSKYALLIGINTYQPPGTTVKRPAGTYTGRFAPGAPRFNNLSGPTFDVAAMRSVLTSSKFGFPDDEQHLHVVENSEATRDGILAAMNKYLVEQPGKGDTVVFYVASHGSLRVNSKSNKQVFDVDGKPTPLESTIVPADAYLGAEDVRDREMARIFHKAADKGIHLTAIFDSCHSGSTARGAMIGPRTMARMLAYDPRDIAEAPDTAADGTGMTAPEDRTDNPVLVLTAAQVDQTAAELSDSTPPHGVFTLALISALEELPANISATDLWKRIKVDLEVQGFTNQQPQLDGTRERKEQPLFGGVAEKGRLRAAVLSPDEDGAVVLDVGPVDDVGTGSEFVALSETKKVVLRITGAIGLNRSTAAILSPPGAYVAAKDIFELSRRVPAEKPNVRFWVPASTLTQTLIDAAVREVKSSGVALVSDPSQEPWSHLIRWDGAQWTLEKAGSRDAEPLGGSLSSALLKRKLPQEARVWLDLPPSAELSRQLLMNSPQSATQFTANAEEALYMLAGMPSDAGPVYAWYNRAEFIAGRQTPAGYGKGCSPDTPYPIRTNWTSGDGAAETLRQSAEKLARLNFWLHLQSNETGESDYPYHLAVQRLNDKTFAADEAATHKGEEYQLALEAKGDTRAEPRFVYLMSIDCQGNGQLMFPRHGAGNRYPQQDGRLQEIPLPNSRFSITPPFGTDTYILLTTSTELADPEALNFSGVVRAGERGAPASPLELLLRASGSRGSMAAMPTDWGVESLELHSQPH